MSKKSSPFASQCIIQWYGDSVITGNGQRDQQNFVCSNNGNQSLTQAGLEQNKSDYFKYKESSNSKLSELSKNSYYVSPKRHKVKTVDAGTTDVFLYGHSTYREYITPKDGIDAVRGISIGSRYVSAGKVAKFLDSACRIVKHDELRIWLLSCHTSMDDLPERYIVHLAEKLEKLGWRNKQLIGFNRGVNTLTLLNARTIASKTDLYDELKLKTLAQWVPYVYLL
ncbi:hypothetical protein V4841_21985 [Lelliottia amnigena]|uniref:Uncharacterized protein n=1 Tax=Lelliottia amnigena TaxID=61646 RepID=A0ABU7UGN7_LELAM|nr:hypothetical protein [Enterobacter sp. 166D1]